MTGLVSTTFGDAANKHVADWKRAGQVLAVLKQVWNRSKTACTDLPASPTAAIDAAVISAQSLLTRRLRPLRVPVQTAAPAPAAAANR